MNYRRVYLDGYSYFITMVTYKRRAILIENIDVLRNAFRYAKKRYNFKIEAIVILPDHLHMIITPKNSKDYSKIVSNIKRAFIYRLDSKFKDKCKFDVEYSKYKRGNAGIWQERFYEHTIRNEDDLLETIKYIQNNPIKHNLVCDYRDWKYIYLPSM